MLYHGVPDSVSQFSGRHWITEIARDICGVRAGDGWRACSDANGCSAEAMGIFTNPAGALGASEWCKVTHDG